MASVRAAPFLWGIAESHRSNQIHAHASRRGYSLWGNQAGGKSTKIDKGIFDHTVENTHHRSVHNRVDFPKPRLVPDKWRDLQDELNKSKKQRRIDNLRGKLSRAEQEKAKLREVIIEEEEDTQQHEDDAGQVTHMIFPGASQMYQATDGSDQGASQMYQATDGSDQGRTQTHQVEYLASDASEKDIQVHPTDYNGSEEEEDDFSQKVDLSLKLVEDMDLPKRTREIDQREELHFTPEEKKLFKKRDANIDRITSEKWMPLHTLAISGQTFMIHDLIEQGAAVDDVDKDGVTALCKAVQAGQVLAVKVLIRAGANVFFRDKHGATLLHHAIANDCPTIVKLLLKRGVDINSVDNEGFTPLHVAVQSQKKAMLRALLRHGADKTMVTKDGLTPLDLAFGYGSSFNSNAIIVILKTQKPVLEVMKHFKGCEEAAERIVNEGLNNEPGLAKNDEKALVNTSRWTPITVREWAKGELLF